jgi:hypothetical protein
MILWLQDPNKMPIHAQIPRGNTEFEKMCRQMVLKYQLHKCVPLRCFKSDNKYLKKCKYGFPFKTPCDEHLASDGGRYFYKRNHQEDSTVVPYNLELMLMWGGHVNVQNVTKHGLEHYLVKYISKIEPTFFAKVSEKTTEVEKYFNLRVVSSIEASAMVLGHHFVQSDVKVLFLDTTLPGKAFKFLKNKEELGKMDPEDDNIFRESLFDTYLERPKEPEFDNITYLDFYRNYRIEKETFIKRNSPIVVRYNKLTPNDGEQFFYQLLILNISFRSINSLISNENISKTYHEECILREIYYGSCDLTDEIHLKYNNNNNKCRLDLTTEANKLFMKNNNMLTNYDFDDILYINKNNENEVNEHIENVIECDEDNSEEGDRQLRNLLNINYELPQQIKKFEQDIELLTKSQREIFDHVRANLNSQCLMFVTGPGGVGKSFLVDILNKLAKFNALLYANMATTGQAAKLINGKIKMKYFFINQ